MYAKSKEGVLSYTPVNYELEDEKIITNFNQSEELIKEYEFKNVIDNRPIYDYTENKENITINYIINEILVTQGLMKNIYEQRLQGDKLLK